MANWGRFSCILLKYPYGVVSYNENILNKQGEVHAIIPKLFKEEKERGQTKTS